MATNTMNMSTGTVSWMRILCRAWLTGPDSRQSVDRLPLLTVAKANWAALKTQCTVLGAGMLMEPKRVMYCSHKFSACVAPAIHQLVHGKAGITVHVMRMTCMLQQDSWMLRSGVLQKQGKKRC